EEAWVVDRRDEPGVLELRLERRLVDADVDDGGERTALGLARQDGDDPIEEIGLDTRVRAVDAEDPGTLVGAIERDTGAGERATATPRDDPARREAVAPPIDTLVAVEPDDAGARSTRIAPAPLQTARSRSAVDEDERAVARGRDSFWQQK